MIVHACACVCVCWMMQTDRPAVGQDASHRHWSFGSDLRQRPGLWHEALSVSDTVQVVGACTRCILQCWAAGQVTAAMSLNALYSVSLTRMQWSKVRRHARVCAKLYSVVGHFLQLPAPRKLCDIGRYLSVCCFVFASSITQKVTGGFGWILQGRLDLAQPRGD